MMKLMKNGKKYKFYKLIVANVAFFMLCATIYITPEIIHHIKNLILAAILLSVVITLFIVSAVLTVSYWEDILTSEDPK